MTSLTLSITSPQKELMGSQATKTFNTNGGTIGRASRNDWVLPEETVSSQHALISFQDNNFFITDLSTNGVYIDGSKVPLGTGCTAPLVNAQTLSIGLYLISINVEISQDSQSTLSPLSTENTFEEPLPEQDQSFLSDSSNDPLDLLGLTSPNESITSNNSLPEDLFADSQAAPLTQDQQAFESAPSPSVADAFIAPSTHTAPPESSSTIPDNWDETCFSPAQPTNQNIIEEKPAIPMEDTGSTLADEADLASQQTLIVTTDPEPEPDKPTEHNFEQSHKVNEREKPIQQPSTKLKEKINTQNDNDTNYESDQLTLAMASFQKNGLDTSLLKDSAFVDQSLALLPHVIEGVLATLRSRSQIKNELRASQTILQQVENNPLKFSINLQDAFHNLLINQRPGFLSPEDAIKQAFQDLTQHEAALIMGIQTGLNAMLKKISPEAIETKIENLETKKNIFGKISSAKKWEYYKETYQHITENSSNSFIDMFGDDFVKGYEAYISNNKQNGR